MQATRTAMFYEDFEVGQAWETPRRTISETDLVMFAAISGDQHPMHTDQEFAERTDFGGRILHGIAALAFASGLESRLALREGTGIAFLGLTCEMRGPVRMGDTIRVRERVAAKRLVKEPGRGIVTFRIELLNQRDELVQEGDWKMMVRCRAGSTGQV
jgi:acyl dehydratase